MWCMAFVVACDVWHLVWRVALHVVCEIFVACGMGHFMFDVVCDRWLGIWCVACDVSCGVWH